MPTFVEFLRSILDSADSVEITYKHKGRYVTESLAEMQDNRKAMDYIQSRIDEYKTALRAASRPAAPVQD